MRWTITVLLLMVATTIQADSLPRQAFEPVALSALEQGQLELGDKLHYLEDTDDQLRIDDLLSQPNQWQPVDSAVPNFGFTRSAFWFHAELHNDLGRDVSYLLEIANPILDYADLYLVKDGQLIDTLHTGDQRPFDDRPIDHRNLLLPLNLAGGLDPVRRGQGIELKRMLTHWQILLMGGTGHRAVDIGEAVAIVRGPFPDSGRGIGGIAHWGLLCQGKIHNAAGTNGASR